MTSTSSKKLILIYGCYGYTGELIVQRATQKNIPIRLSGRNLEKCKFVAKKYGLNPILDVVKIDLKNKNELEKRFNFIKKDTNLVVNVAGPYIETFDILIQKCIESGISYLDVTGELDIFKNALRLDTLARQANITIIPGCGITILATDCIASYLKSRLEDSVKIELAMGSINSGGISTGTAKTIIHQMGEKSSIRYKNKIVEIDYLHKYIPLYSNTHKVPVTNITTGDIVTVYQSTKIPSISTFINTNSTLTDWIMFILSFSIVRFFVKLIPLSLKYMFLPKWGPNEKCLNNGSTYIWGEVTNRIGKRASARIKTFSGYKFTALAVSYLMERFIKNDKRIKKGVQTPSSIFGYKLMTEIDERASFEDIE